MEDLEGHQALVNYRYTLRYLLMDVTGTAEYIFEVIGALASM